MSEAWETVNKPLLGMDGNTVSNTVMFILTKTHGLFYLHEEDSLRKALCLFSSSVLPPLVSPRSVAPWRLLFGARTASRVEGLAHHHYYQSERVARGPPLSTPPLSRCEEVGVHVMLMHSRDAVMSHLYIFISYNTFIVSFVAYTNHHIANMSPLQGNV